MILGTILLGTEMTMITQIMEGVLKDLTTKIEKEVTERETGKIEMTTILIGVITGIEIETIKLMVGIVDALTVGVIKAQAAGMIKAQILGAIKAQVVGVIKTQILGVIKVQMIKMTEVQMDSETEEITTEEEALVTIKEEDQMDIEAEDPIDTEVEEGEEEETLMAIMTGNQTAIKTVVQIMTVGSISQITIGMTMEVKIAIPILTKRILGVIKKGIIEAGRVTLVTRRMIGTKMTPKVPGMILTKDGTQTHQKIIAHGVVKEIEDLIISQSQNLIQMIIKTHGMTVEKANIGAKIIQKRNLGITILRISPTLGVSLIKIHGIQSAGGAIETIKVGQISVKMTLILGITEVITGEEKETTILTTERDQEIMKMGMMDTESTGMIGLETAETLITVSLFFKRNLTFSLIF